MKRILFTLSILLVFSIGFTSVFAQKKETRSMPKFDVVEFGKTTVLTDGNRVWLEWNTDSEVNNLGFNVYRVGQSDQKARVLVNPSIIIGSALNTGDKNSGGTFNLLDRNGNMQSAYFIEAISIGGSNKTLGPIYPQYVNDLSDRDIDSSPTADTLEKKSNAIVERENPIIPKELAESKSNRSISTAQETQFWIASQNAAKINVKQSGLYRVTRSQLSTAGFDVNASVGLWQLYADGIEQPIIVDPSGNFIEFFGNGLDTLYSDTKTYYLVVGLQAGKRIGNSFRRSIREGVVSKSFGSSFERLDNQSYISSLLNGEPDNFFGTLFNNAGSTVTINVPAVENVTSGLARIDFRVQGLTNTPHTVTISLNGQQIGTINGNNMASMDLSHTLNSQSLLDGNNVIQLSTANSGSYCMFDRVKITYPKKYISTNGRLAFSVPNYRSVKIEGFGSQNVRLFDVSDSSKPSFITNTVTRANGSTFDLIIPSNRTRMMYAIADENLLTATSVVANIPSNLSSTAKQANFVIITHRNFISQANDWATYRRNQGLLVEVVDVEDVYDEFGFGALDASSIKNFLGYAKASWLVKPDYVLLIGDTTFDNRNYQGSAAAYSLLPSEIIDTSYSETVSDEFLADFNDDGLSELAIGRIPATTTAFVTQMLNKTITFELTRVGALMQRGMIFASDLPNGWDFEGTNVNFRALLPAAMPATMVNRGQTDGRAVLLAAANQGKYMIHYSGHGSISFWATSTFFHRDDAFAMTNGSNLTIFNLLTCLNGFFHNNGTDSFVEGALKAPNGGAVATWASTGLTTPDVQDVMATRYYQKINDGSIERLGDLIRDAKTTLVYGRDVRLSWALLGDPTLRVK
jgi:Peptidase family C25